MGYAKRIITSALLSFGLAGAAFAGDGVGGLDVYFMQGGKSLATERASDDHLRLNLTREDFEIHFTAGELGVCASTRPEVFNKVAAGTRIMADPKSCLFIYKAFGMGDGAGSLIVDSDGANWLNPAHGARKGDNGRNIFWVGGFAGRETGEINLAQVKQPIYLSIWDDRNNDKMVDQGEVARVELNFR